jgi:hypothetical protein
MLDFAAYIHADTKTQLEFGSPTRIVIKNVDVGWNFSGLNWLLRNYLDLPKKLDHNILQQLNSKRSEERKKEEKRKKMK